MRPRDFQLSAQRPPDGPSESQNSGAVPEALAFGDCSAETEGTCAIPEEWWACGVAIQPAPVLRRAGARHGAPDRPYPAARVS